MTTREYLNEHTFLESPNRKRLAKRPYCSDDLAHGLTIRDLEKAMKMRYIQLNPPHLKAWLTFDIDRPFTDPLLECIRLKIPPPSITMVNRQNGHAHLTWGLEAPVLVQAETMSQKPIRYLCAIESAYREALQADMGYSGLITKTPMHPHWERADMYLQIPLYTLGDLAACVDLKKFVPKRGKDPEEFGIGRNVCVFHWLRKYSYKNIRRFKESRTFEEWKDQLSLKALERNGEFLTPLDHTETKHIVKSVSNWTWNRFDIAASDARYSKLQSYRGKQNKPEIQAIKGAIGGLSNDSEVQAEKGRLGGLGNSPEIQATKGRISGLNRLEASENQRATARLMAAKGMSSRAIGAELGIHQSTVVRWLNQSK